MTIAPIEVEVDTRGRVSIGKLAKGRTRYRLTELEDGELLLTPVVSISERELALLRNPAQAHRLRGAIEEAEAGKLTRHAPGHFGRLAANLGADEDSGES